MNNENVSKKYEPRKFETIELFNGYSRFCQSVLKKLNDKILKKYEHYFICTRNGTDPKITFKEFNHEGGCCKNKNGAVAKSLEFND